MQRKDITISEALKKDYRTLYDYYEIRQRKLKEEASQRKLTHHQTVEKELYTMHIKQTKPTYRLVESLIEVIDGSFTPSHKESSRTYKLTQAVNRLRIGLHQFLYER